MSDNVTSILQRYARPVSKLQETGDKSKEVYRPFDLEPNAGHAHRLRVNYSNGTVNLFLYGNMFSVFAAEGGISLLFHSGVVDIEGEHIYDLLDELHNDRIRTLHAYDPKKHVLDESSKIIIRQMEFKDMDEVVGRK